MRHQATQRHRVNRVINTVHANLHRDIDLDRMADVACMSKYHFVRLFDTHVGQTPLRYLNRVRLERAARQLIFRPTAAVGKIATECGFTSHQSFTRAFGRHFGHVPHQGRTLDSKRDPNMPIAAFNDADGKTTVRVGHSPATRIAYIRHFGPYQRDRGDIHRSSQLLRDWAESRGLNSKTPLLGLCPDNRRITPAHYCVYDVGIPVPDEISEDDVVSILTIPAGRYAIAHVHCRNEQIISAWDWLCSTWRESRSAPYEQRWNYEIFPASFDGHLNPEYGMDICLRLSDV